MTNDKIIFDDWRTIGFAVFLALVGYTVMVTVPVLSTAVVQSLGFTEEQAGRVWGNDMLGFSAGAITAALTVSRLNRRSLVTAGIILTIGGNVMCMHLTSYEAMMILRVATGIGSGIFTGTAIATLGGSTKPVTAFNILLFGFAFSSAGQLYVFSNLPLNGIYWFIIGTTALCGILLRWLPERPLNESELAQQTELQNQGDAWNVPLYMPILCLVAICFTYINIGGYFTYVELAALEDGIEQELITSLLTWASFLTLAGCALAMVCARFGLFRPLILALLAMTILVSMLSGGITNVNLAISLFAFMSLWTFVDVYQSSMMGYMDRSGSLVALIPSVQGFGQFIGPNIAASILAAGLGYGVMFAVSSSMALIAMFIYIGMYMRMR